MRELTGKQKRFVEEYLCDLNATQAAIRAGYSAKTAEVVGYENLRKPQIAAAIQAEMDKRSARTEMTQDAVLLELRKLASSDIRKVFDDQGRLLPVHMLPDDIAPAVSSVKVTTSRVPGTDPVEVEFTTEVKFWDKPKAIDLAGKHLMLWKEVGSKENPLTVESLSDDELDARIAALEAKR